MAKNNRRVIIRALPDETGKGFRWLAAFPDEAHVSGRKTKIPCIPFDIVSGQVVAKVREEMNLSFFATCTRSVTKAIRKAYSVEFYVRQWLEDDNTRVTFRQYVTKK